MGIGVYTKEDLANILGGLASAEQAKEDSREQTPTQCEQYYHGGFKAALVALGLSVGLGPMVQVWRADGPTWIGVETNG